MSKSHSKMDDYETSDDDFVDPEMDKYFKSDKKAKNGKTVTKGKKEKPVSESEEEEEEEEEDEPEEESQDESESEGKLKKEAFFK